jgi:N-acetylneuraminic acid mutarotase
MKLTKEIYHAIFWGLFGITVLVTSHALAQENAWETKTPMPTARFAHRVAAIDGLLYVVGGNDGVTGAVGTLEVYDPNSDTWSTAASMPGIRYGGTNGVIDGKLYMVGGWNWPISGIPTNTLQIYDPQADTWSTGANMPILSGCSIAGVIDRKLYVLTPCNGYSFPLPGYFKFFHVYDPDTDTWTELTQPDKIQAEAAGGVINGKFYVVGGFDGGAITATMQVFDPESGTWSIEASMSVPRQVLGAGVIDEKLYVVGGQNGTGISVADTMEVFDPYTDNWSSAPPMPTARGALNAGVIDGELYAVGGWDESGPLATLEVFGPVATAPETSAPEVNGGEVVLNGTEGNDSDNTTVFENVAVTVETPLEIQCNSPATIVPPDAPISFTATATDTYGSMVPAMIIGVDCFKFTEKGKRIDKTESCVVSKNKDTVTISDSGGVGDHITWTVTAGNNNDTCEVVVVNPGKGKGQSKKKGH